MFSDYTTSGQKNLALNLRYHLAYLKFNAFFMNEAMHNSLRHCYKYVFKQTNKCKKQVAEAHDDKGHSPYDFRHFLDVNLSLNAVLSAADQADCNQ